MKTLIITFAAVTFLTSTAQACDPQVIDSLIKTIEPALIASEENGRTFKVKENGIFELPTPWSFSTARFFINVYSGQTQTSKNPDDEYAIKEWVYGGGEKLPKEIADSKALGLQAYSLNYEPSGNNVTDFKNCFRAFHTAYSGFRCKEGYYWCQLQLEKDRFSEDTLVYARKSDMKYFLFLDIMSKQFRCTKPIHHNDKSLMIVERVVQEDDRTVVNVKFMTVETFISSYRISQRQSGICGIKILLGQLAVRSGAPIEADY